ncbi:unnamed protein product [Brassica napus]|uniref:(rape) hypothetical protein n=1 Tax=Brassica napus TaxID=3708 RepID=A0A816VDC9_BRANA|nr:unnamed protein product [Brassica napus]
MARALRNPPSPRRYMAMEPSPECASRHGAKGERHFKHIAAPSSEPPVYDDYTQTILRNQNSTQEKQHPRQIKPPTQHTLHLDASEP